MRRRFYGLIIGIAAIIFTLFSIRSTLPEREITSSVFLTFAEALDVSRIPKARSDQIVPFIAESFLGYADPLEELLYVHPFKGRAAIDRLGWITYDRLATDLKLYDLNGGGQQFQAYAYPWFKASWRVLLRADQMGIAVMDKTGLIRWEKEFPTPITAIDASSLFLAVGTLDGSISVFDPNGWAILSMQNSLQEFQTIYGLALSADSNYLIIVRGISPKKIETYRFTDNSFAKVSESSLMVNTTFQATIAIARDNSHAIMSFGDMIIYYNIKNKYYRILEAGMAGVELSETQVDFRYFVLGSLKDSLVAILRSDLEGKAKSDVIILNHGLPVHIAPGAFGAIGDEEVIGFVYKDGLELLKGWRP
ncbi:MAG TPA: WD40 repeat domain-containing protein [Rectinema sp.]|jgi:hypothetical protein|nr:MAG: hypothetical protein BWX44_01092 [Spirochaetes bacterium ADurb.Bin001]HNP92623.1 WD40 repeat domain-containing protein [Rectinema sp.]HNT58822.1 WD40 repeat domain-containing protein [Rectinema sp.]HNV35873.1 WD40 repeat domain-containing protein [Rectinema sp.]HOC27864.1 WD40 repeat domain-containing protein [Rectinema sp.]